MEFYERIHPTTTGGPVARSQGRNEFFPLACGPEIE